MKYSPFISTITSTLFISAIILIDVFAGDGLVKNISLTNNYLWVS